jgi:hypothetical protein
MRPGDIRVEPWTWTPASAHPRGRVIALALLAVAPKFERSKCWKVRCAYTEVVAILRTMVSMPLPSSALPWLSN